jgi:hypothetical protein
MTCNTRQCKYYLVKFLRDFVGSLQLSYENNTGDHIIHAFNLATDGPNELKQCILLGALYVQRVVHTLNDRFPNLLVFNATKLFSPRNNPSDDNDQITNTKLWLERILLSFNTQKKKVTCVRVNSWKIRNHFDMSVRQNKI